MRNRAFEFACVCLLALAAASMMSSSRVAEGSTTAVIAANGSHASAASAAAESSASAPAGTEWAAWINRDVEIDLQDLPQTYSCDQLWYKLRAVLLAIGAREYMAIEPYYCGKGARDGGRSPSLHLRFQTLRTVTGKEVRWANTRAVEQTVVLKPGEPKRLDAGDCALVKQLQGTLFAYLDIPVSAARFECAAPSQHDFDLSVRVLERWPKPNERAPD